MKESRGKHIFVSLKELRVAFLAAMMFLCAILLVESISFGQTSPKKKSVGFSAEILPVNVDKEEPTGMPAESYQVRSDAKKELLDQRNDQESLMTQLKHKPQQAEEVPLKKKV